MDERAKRRKAREKARQQRAATVFCLLVTTIILDSAFLMVDQAMNRESYKQEIIDDINEQRNSMLALLEQKPQTE